MRDLRRIRVLATAAAVVALLTAAASPARADTTLEVRPGLSPFFSDGKNGSGPREYVTRNLSTEARNQYLRSCRSGYSCYAVGEGDGQHTFFELYYCDNRNLTNFLGRGAAVNHQTDEAVAYLRDRESVTRQEINPDNIPVSVDWNPIWYIHPC
ncbi:hypothetical protein RM555_16025 [Micromonospora sp. DSM 115977]|uniref:Peptidase inhibitor family I36 n=1 Tax=Micromonospora reichwaldensis TaxID=3075516 RepID=A0ABU2WX43_9ACTN|nr:hypothetical protein [Micromonospora sp. DSM 115977]MDT0530500.1 hypothetical protein [Micromonospora sp. DSM 115977]